MEHKGTVELSSERLILRKFSPADAEPMYRNWAADPEVTKYLSWPAHKDKALTEKIVGGWIREYENPAFYQWAIVPKDLQEPIGTISIVGMDEKTDTLQLGYCIGKKWWHQGYTSEALKKVIPFLFLELGAKRIEARHDPDNPNSGAVMRKCALKYEGTLRRAERNNQGIVDAAVYSILADEFKNAYL